ncbi:MAG: TlyA family RNA methyltransferase [Eubacteriales bacterium]|nr:TlyA family RNA methyltransferase [Eubacteriales bacterium]
MKRRLDELLLARQLCNDIKEARALIMAGRVLIDERVEDKPGMSFAERANIRIKTKKSPYVSRGGLKLEKAFDTFHLDVHDKVCMDAGCSTGGFTHLLLARGARKVYAVDVGSGQLDWRLRNDERVVVMERTNVRYLTPSDLPDPPRFLCADLSFISLKTVLPVFARLLPPGGEAVVLIKPQFEAARDEVASGGIVHSEIVRQRTVDEVLAAAEAAGFMSVGVTTSPIKGAKGNVEYPALLKRV